MGVVVTYIDVFLVCGELQVSSLVMQFLVQELSVTGTKQVVTDGLEFTRTSCALWADR